MVSQVADRVAVMYAGNLVELGSKRDIFQAPAHPYTRGLLNAVPHLEDGPRSSRSKPSKARCRLCMQSRRGARLSRAAVSRASAPAVFRRWRRLLADIRAVSVVNAQCGRGAYTRRGPMTSVDARRPTSALGHALQVYNRQFVR